MGLFRPLFLFSFAIFAGELMIMFVLNHVEIPHGVMENFVDAVLLVLFVFPVMYFFVFRTSTIARERLEGELRARTEEIEGTNRALQRSVEKLDRRQQEMVLLGETGNLFQACHDTSEAMIVAGMQLRRLFPRLSGSLFLMNAATDTLEQVANWGGTAANQSGHKPAECWALRRGKPHVTAGSESATACNCMQSHHASWSVCLPLTAEGEALGTLWLAELPGDAHAAGEESGDDRLDFCTVVAESLSLAIANLRLRERLRHQAIRDQLTGLFNRRYLLDALDRELARATGAGQPLCVVMFDIDHFKRFNDSFGHAAGDTVLAHLGLVLREWARNDDVAVRYGGEEFTIVMPGATLDEAAHRVEFLRETIESLAIEHHGQPLAKVTISAGIAAYPAHGSDREALISHADEALYASKRAGRNCVSIAPLPSHETGIAV